MLLLSFLIYFHYSQYAFIILNTTFTILNIIFLPFKLQLPTNS